MLVIILSKRKRKLSGFYAIIFAMGIMLEVDVEIEISPN